MKDIYFAPRRTSASHEPSSTERLINPWYFSQLRLPPYRHWYMQRFHPYPRYPSRPRDNEDFSLDEFVRPAAPPTADTGVGNVDAHNDNDGDVVRTGGKGVIILIVVENLNASAERIVSSRAGRKA